ncbi:hypothetical protein Tco_0986187 [Tanacetum coccineum]
MHFLQPALPERPLKFAGASKRNNGGRKLCTIMDTLTQWEPHSMLAATFSGRHTACKDILYSSLLGFSVEFLAEAFKIDQETAQRLSWWKEAFVRTSMTLPKPSSTTHKLDKFKFPILQLLQLSVERGVLNSVAEKEKHDTLLLEGNLAAIEAKQMDARKAKRAKFVV